MRPGSWSAGLCALGHTLALMAAFFYMDCYETWYLIAMKCRCSKHTLDVSKTGELHALGHTLALMSIFVRAFETDYHNFNETYNEFIHMKYTFTRHICFGSLHGQRRVDIVNLVIVYCFISVTGQHCCS